MVGQRTFSKAATVPLSGPTTYRLQPRTISQRAGAVHVRASLPAMLFVATSLVLAGCSTPYHSPQSPTLPVVAASPAPTIVQAGYVGSDTTDEELPPPNMLDKEPSLGTAIAQAVGLPELIRLGLERNPRLA